MEKDYMNGVKENIIKAVLSMGKKKEMEKCIGPMGELILGLF